MAKLFPNELPYSVRHDPKSRAEIRFYDALKSQLGNDWTVFYHVAWLGLTHPNDAPRDGETDFIVAHPKHGILLIEVKGGRIRYSGESGQWWSIDRAGEEHSIRPFEQVRQCKYALLNKLRSLPDWSRRWIRLSHAVAFPDVTIARKSLPPDAPPEIISDADDLPRLERRILEILAYWQGREPGVQEHGAALVNALERLLAPSGLLRNPLSVEVEEEEREILRLTEEQFRLLDFLGRRRRAAVRGCAGSGKTMLAVEKARRLAREGFRTLILCYHQPLADHLARVVADTANLEARSFRQLCQSAARTAGIPLQVPSETERGGLPDDVHAEALMLAVQVRPDLKFDAIIVDEGQDFQETWWVAIADCLREGKDSILYVFYDDNQRIYADRSRPPIDATDHFPMTENVRNTRAIHRVLGAYYRGENASRSRGPVGRSIEIQPYTTERELATRLGGILHRLVVSEGVRSSMIVVLTPRSLDASVLPRLRFENGFRLVERPSTNPREVLCASVSVFKGLERAIVIIAELDEQVLREDLRVNLCYVAFSRPRSHLILMGREDVLHQLVDTAQDQYM